ncbi:MAG: SMI1/KNR4 family protein [Oscillospiraceae bacterium]|nr:SMI1/KNR4 family protein [Oscillospiraceae bacterium]
MNIRVDDFFMILKKYFPDMDERLKKPDKEALNCLKQAVSEKGYEFDPQLSSLYEYADGENDDLITSVMAGFEFISAQKALDNFLFFSDPQYASNYEWKRKYTDAVQEKSSAELCWIPFAHDASRCFFAVDLTPDINGRKGQVIGVDGDTHKVYLMAGSLTEFFGTIIQYLYDGILVIGDEEEERYMEAGTGHLLDMMDEIHTAENK